MNNYNWILRTFLFPTLFLCGLLLLLNKLVNAQNTSEQTKLAWTNIFQAATKKPKPPVKPRKPGSRPTDATICMISPDAPDQTRIVWSDRPLFLWQGKVNKIAVRRKGSNVYLWSQSVTSAESTTYTGNALQPGQTYEWVVNDNTFVPFQVMKAEPRKLIAEELTNLEKQQPVQGTSTENIALIKANYFAKAQLWSDVFQETYSVPQPSTNLLKMRQELVVELCK